MLIPAAVFIVCFAGIFLAYWTFVVRREQEAVGVDAARYSLTRFSVDSNIDIDLGLLTRRSNENPVFYVQYAHARTCAVGRNAEAAGVARTDERGEAVFDASLLDHPMEGELLAALGQYPSVLAQAPIVCGGCGKPFRIPETVGAAN